METSIARYSYWLGFVCVVLTLLRRGLGAIGIWLPTKLPEGSILWHVSYFSFYRASLMFFLLAIACASHVWLKSQRS